MYLHVNDDSVRFTGRWDIGEERAVTTTPGSMIEVAYSGVAAVLHFDMEMNMYPYPHLWISVDDSAKIEVPVDHVIRVEAPEDGNHVIKIIYKSAVEFQHRWHHPLVGKISFEGVEAEGIGSLPKDDRRIIEFLGDSITEGVLVDAAYQYEKFDQFNRPNQDDATATYAYLTAINLGRKPVIMGYGGTGVTKGGCGSIPKAGEAYPYNFDGSDTEPQNLELVVINYGANDEKNGVKKYLAEYEEFLKIVRKRNPKAKIVVLSAFCGVFPLELKALVNKFNQENNDNIYFIDSTGWIPIEPLHPLREGHRAVAEHLTEELKIIINKEKNM